MPNFKENANAETILKLLKDFNSDRRRVLFGDAEWFSNWLRSQGVEGIVSIKEFNLNSINIFKYTFYLNFVMKKGFGSF